MKKHLFSVFTTMFILFSLQINAQTWSAIKRLTWNTGVSANQSIAADTGNGIYVVWEDNTSGNKEIYYKRSTNGGTSWLAIKRLTWNAGGSWVPSIVVDSGSGIHVVWTDDTPGNEEIFYKSSTNSGVSWSTPKRLTWNVGSSLGQFVAADSGNGIHIVWEDDTSGNIEIFYKRSTNSGTSWLAPRRLTWNAGESYNPSVSADSGNGIHVVWEDDTTGNGEIFYKRSTDSGASWSSVRRLTWNSGWSWEPSIIADSGSGIHVVWTDDTPGNGEIFYKSSTNAGVTWSSTRRMTWNAGGSENPFISLDSGNVLHVAWMDGTPGNSEIFHKHSTVAGASWSVTKRLSWNSGLSLKPSIATDSSSGIHIVWHDNSPGNYEIFYKNRK